MVMAAESIWPRILLALSLLGPGAVEVLAAPKEESVAEKARSLATAWLPSRDYPFRNYAKVTLILGYVAAGIEPPSGKVREGLASMDPKGMAGRLVSSRGLLGGGAAVIIDAPGPMSAALAVELAEQSGFQPVPLLNGVPGPAAGRNGADGGAQTLAALMLLRERGAGRGSRAGAPPAFFLDRSRLRPGAAVKGALLLPTGETLERRGVTRVLYLYERAEGEPGEAADERGRARDLSTRLSAIEASVPVETMSLKDLR